MAPEIEGNLLSLMVAEQTMHLTNKKAFAAMQHRLTEAGITSKQMPKHLPACWAHRNAIKRAAKHKTTNLET